MPGSCNSTPPSSLEGASDPTVSISLVSPVRFMREFVKDVFQAQPNPVSKTTVNKVQEHAFSSLPEIIMVVLHVWASLPQSGDNLLEKGIAYTEVHKSDLRNAVGMILDPLLAHHTGHLLRAFVVHLSTMLEGEAEPAMSVLTDVIGYLESATPKLVLRGVRLFVKEIYTDLAKTSEGDAHRNQSRNFKYENLTLRFVQVYISSQSPEKVKQAWHPLLSLLKESAQFQNPASVLLRLNIINTYVLLVKDLDNSHYVKELQNVTHQIVDDLVMLTQPKFLKKNSTLEVEVMPSVNPVDLRLKALRVLSAIVSLLHTVFQGQEERRLGILSAVVQAIHHIIKDRRTENFEAAHCVACFVAELCQHSYSQKAWKKELSEVFYNEPCFFDMDPASVPPWCTIVNNMMVTDKQAFPELLRNVTKSVALQPAMFGRAESTAPVQIRALQTLAFTVYAGGMDQYASYLGSIQERLAEALKSSDKPTVIIYRKVLLCMRVLLLRFTSSKLRSFWPVMLTELMRIFGYGKAGRDPKLVVDACKLLELAVLLRLQDFNLHEWIFVKDWPEQLSTEEAEITKTFVPFVYRFEKTGGITTMSLLSNSQEGRSSKPPKRGPLLRMHTDSVTSGPAIRDALAAFNQLVYESSIQHGEPDMEAITKVIELDLVNFTSPSALLTIESDDAMSILEEDFLLIPLDTTPGAATAD